jgi:hypothetical protein
LPDRVRVSDDEIGIEPAVLPREVRAGHWGLQAMPERPRHINGQLEVWSESGVGTEARVVDLAHPKDCCAERNDAVPADFAVDSPGTAPLAQARGLDLIDDVGTINTVRGQFNAFCGKPAKHGTPTFVDGRDLAQVKKNRFSP